MVISMTFAYVPVQTPELPFRLAMILMEFLDLRLVDNHFKCLHKLFIIKN